MARRDMGVERVQPRVPLDLVIDHEPQYEIRSDKSEHIAAHKGAALRKID